MRFQVSDIGRLSNDKYSTDLTKPPAGRGMAPGPHEWMLGATDLSALMAPDQCSLIFANSHLFESELV